MVQLHKARILQHVKHKSYQPRRVEALAEELNVGLGDLPAFRQAVEELVESGQVVIGASDTLALPPLGRTVTGRFRLNDRGFGFVIPDQANAHGDLFVPAHRVNDAMTGDIVRAEVVFDRQRSDGVRSPYTGRVTDILQRGNSTFVGVLQKRGAIFVVMPDGKTLTDAIVVRDPGAKRAQPGMKVVVELTKYPHAGFNPEGVIVEVLGDAGEPDVETVGVCRMFGLADRFPEPVLQEARDVVRRYEGPGRAEFLKHRLDLRNDYIITIDPPDAQDYDDAISLRDTPQGVELGVHIADVATFVPHGSALDQEAAKRGNSAYLPRRVVPMLPEVLSNGICSLQPGVDRLTRSAFITYDDAGRPRASRFASTVIRSAHRLTYIEAQALIDGDLDTARKHAKYDGAYTDRLIAALRSMNELAMRIRKRRLDDGMIVLDLPEVELVYDDSGRVVDAQPEDDSFTHKLIEAFMVEANEAVARAFSDLDVPLIRRVHPDPGSHDVSALRQFAHVAGYNIPKNPTRKELQTLLDATRDKPAAKAVHFAVLRTLTKAEYAPDLIGHFALASEHYTHFTSPIRRYADLLVHRAFDALLEANAGHDRLPGHPLKRKELGRKLMQDPRVLDEQALRIIGKHISTTERNAEAAEDELRSFLVLQLLAGHVGEDFPGTVTGVTNFGVFIQIDKYLIEGMIRATELPGGASERWKLSPTGSLVAQRSGRAVNIGDQFRVKIVRVDLARREMSLQIVDARKLERSADPARAVHADRKRVKTKRLEKRRNPERKNKFRFR
jgi:ribonuclease R